MPCLPPHNFEQPLFLITQFDITVVPRESEDNASAKIWEVNKVCYGRCANGKLKQNRKTKQCCNDITNGK